MSRCLCKYGEGAGFPFQVKSLEDGVDDAVHTFYVYKAGHGTSPPANFDEATLNHARRKMDERAGCAGSRNGVFRPVVLAAAWLARVPRGNGGGGALAVAGRGSVGGGVFGCSSLRFGLLGGG